MVTEVKATSVPMDTRSARTSRGTKNASRATMEPVKIVATTGLSVRGWTLACTSSTRTSGGSGWGGRPEARVMEGVQEVQDTYLCASLL